MEGVGEVGLQEIGGDVLKQSAIPPDGFNSSGVSPPAMRFSRSQVLVGSPAFPSRTRAASLPGTSQMPSVRRYQKG